VRHDHLAPSCGPHSASNARLDSSTFGRLQAPDFRLQWDMSRDQRKLTGAALARHQPWDEAKFAAPAQDSVLIRGVD